MSSVRRWKASITRRVGDYTASPSKRKDRPGSSLDRLGKKAAVLIKFSNMRAKSRGAAARIVYTYPVRDRPVDKSGRICEKQKISGSLYAMIRGPDRDPGSWPGKIADSNSHVTLLHRVFPTCANNHEYSIVFFYCSSGVRRVTFALAAVSCPIAG